MYQLTIIYNKPGDAETFDNYYESQHLPLVANIHGLERFTSGKCEALDGNPPSAYSIAQLSFASKDAAIQALTSPEGQAAAGDVVNFADGGFTLHYSDETTVLP